MENSISQEKEDTSPSIRYIDLSIKQLDKEIIEQTNFINSYCSSDYHIREALEHSKEIQANKKGVEQEYKAYKERIKGYQARLNKARKELKESERKIRGDEDFKANQTFLLNAIIRIRANKSIGNEGAELLPVANMGFEGALSIKHKQEGLK